jgi:hypothetical protein
MTIPIPMLDLMFFLTETRENPRHVGALLVFERPKSSRSDFVGRVVDSFRRAVPVAPFNRVPLFRKAGLPEWQEVETLDMDWHVQRLAVPAPGSASRLHQLVAELHEPMLERDRHGPPERVDDPADEVLTARLRSLEDEQRTDVPRVLPGLRQEEHQVEHRDRDGHGSSSPGLPGGGRSLHSPELEGSRAGRSSPAFGARPRSGPYSPGRTDVSRIAATPISGLPGERT